MDPKNVLKKLKYEKKVMSGAERFPYYHNYGPTRMAIHNIIASKYFDLAIAAVIGVNVISMAMEYHLMPNILKYILRALNYFFTAIFTLEAACKLYALGFRKFFDER